MKTKTIINILKEKNPYPANIFIEPTEKQWKKASQVLRKNKIVPDAIFGSWGRRVWNLCIEEFEQISKS